MVMRSVGKGSGNSSLTFFRQDLGGWRRRGKTKRHGPEPFARLRERRMKAMTQKSQTVATFPQSVTMELGQAPTPSRNTWYLTGHLRHCSCNHTFTKMALNFKNWYCRLGSENCTPLLLRHCVLSLQQTRCYTFILPLGKLKLSQVVSTQTWDHSFIC